MQVGFGRAHVGPLLDHLGRQAERQFGRQLQVSQGEVFRHRLAGVSPRQVGEQVALLGQRLVERGQRGLGLGEGGLLRGDVGARDGAEPGLALQDRERLALGGNNAAGGLDLCAQGGFEDGRGDHVGGERQVGALELEALGLGQRIERFDLAPVAAPDVERIGEGDPGGEQAEDRVLVGERRLQDRRDLVLRRAEGEPDGREERGALGPGIELGDLERRGGGVDVGIGPQRRLDQAVELGRLEDPPPLTRNVEALHDALRLAAGDFGIDKLARRLLLREIGVGLGRAGDLEVGSDRAGAEPCGQGHDGESGTEERLHQ